MLLILRAIFTIQQISFRYLHSQVCFCSRQLVGNFYGAPRAPAPHPFCWPRNRAQGKSALLRLRIETADRDECGYDNAPARAVR